MAILKDHIESTISMVQEKVKGKQDKISKKFLKASPHFCGSDRAIMALQEGLSLKKKRLDKGLTIGGFLLLCLVAFGLIAYVSYQDSIDPAVFKYLVCVVSFTAFVLLVLDVSRIHGYYLLDATEPLSKSTKGCLEMVKLKDQSHSVRRYIETVVSHRQLYHFDLLMSQGLAKVDSYEKELQEGKKACAALHNIQSI